MKEGKTGGKILGLSKRQFIITIAMLCAVALVAEGVLLIHSFLKKPKNASETGKNKTAVTKNDSRIFKVARVYSDDTPSGEEFLYREYEYDSDGNVIGLKTYQQDGRLQFETRTTYYKTARKEERWLPDRSDMPELVTFYDADDESFECIRLIGTEPESYKEIFDAQGNLTELTITYPNSGWDGDIVTRWEYDENGRATKMTQYGYSHGDYPVTFYSHYEYDSEGRLSRMIRNQSELSNSYYIDYTYDGDRRMETKHYGFPSSSWVSTSIEYVGANVTPAISDSEGETQVRIAYDIQAGNWPDDDTLSLIGDLYAERIIKSNGAETIIRSAKYDRDGRPVMYTDEENGARTIAELEYDEQGYNNKIIWNEKYGRTRTYELSYDGNGNLTKLHVTGPSGEEYTIRYEWVEILKQAE